MELLYIQPETRDPKLEIVPTFHLILPAKPSQKAGRSSIQPYNYTSNHHITRK
ncbi:MAG: hypothetical protein K9J27_09860 [Bacteroidales bacterium]|nr:hypothetical protein [Bacteroidales bacterium]MCF8334159.1 hypothetical protein [Bacteroidales bacterium]